MRTVLACLVPLFVPVLVPPSVTPQPLAQRTVTVRERAVRVRQGGAGRHAVVFIAGLGEPLETWSRVAPGVTGSGRVFTYDRPGLGASAAVPGPRDATTLARELNLLAREAGVEGPMILVGHSYGGAIAQVYAAMYRQRVAGLVLVDPADPRLESRLRTVLPPALFARRQEGIRAALGQMPEPVARELHGFDASGTALDASRPRITAPVIVLTATRKNAAFPGNPEEQDAKLAMHRELAAALHAVDHVLVPSSRHYIQSDEPAAVIGAVARIVARRPYTG